MDNLLDRKGGRGQCRYCGEWENNVSFHEAHFCLKNKLGEELRNIRLNQPKVSLKEAQEQAKRVMEAAKSGKLKRG